MSLKEAWHNRCVQAASFRSLELHLIDVTVSVADRCRELTLRDVPSLQHGYHLGTKRLQGLVVGCIQQLARASAEITTFVETLIVLPQVVKGKDAQACQGQALGIHVNPREGLDCLP